MDNELNLSTKQYQVVRQDFFLCQEEPQFTFQRGKAYINSYGLKMFPEKDYIQILIEQEEKTMLIKPLDEKIKDSFKWCGNGEKRQPRHMGCVPLYYMIYQMMNWNLNARYRITGFKQQARGEELLYFDLKNAICFEQTGEADAYGKAVIRKAFPGNWEMNFGMLQQDYESAQLIRRFDREESFSITLERCSRNLNRMQQLQIKEEGEA